MPSASKPPAAEERSPHLAVWPASGEAGDVRLGTTIVLAIILLAIFAAALLQFVVLGKA